MCCWPRVACSLAACRRLQAAVLLLGVSVYLLSLASFTTMSRSADSALNSSDTDPRHCLQQTCVTKCCPEQQAFQSEYNNSCIANTSNSTSSTSFIAAVTALLNESSRDACLKESNSSDVFVLNNRCMKGGSARAIQLERVALQEDGSLLIEDRLRLDVNSDSVCFEFVVASDLLVLEGCVEEAVFTESTFTKVKEVIMLISSTTSTVALISVIVTYSCVSKLRNLQGKLLICYLIPMTLFNLNFVAIDVIPESWLTYPGVISLVQRLAILFLFGWLTWLTIMCYDIWSTFSRPLQSTDARGRCRGGHSGRRKFFSYSLVGWGCPVAHVVALEVFAHDLPGVKRAVVDNFTYITIVLNLVMFLSTLINMSLHHSPHTRTDPRNSRRHGHATGAVFLYLKLALLMGSDWFAVLVSLTFNSDILYYLSLVLLELQGVFLFILLICNKRVRSLLIKKWKGASTTETTSTRISA